MNDAVRFLTQNPVVYMATVDEEGNPRVRPFQYMLEKEGRLYFCTSNQKPVYEQLRRHPLIEMCVSSAEAVWLRLTGRVTFVPDRSVKETIVANNELVRSLYGNADNPAFEVFYLENARGTLSDFSGNPPREFVL